MPRPVCVPCRREMTAEKSGAVQFFAAVSGEDRPYEEWNGDSFKCGTCGATVVTRYASQPTMRSFETEKTANPRPIAKSYEHVMRVPADA